MHLYILRIQNDYFQIIFDQVLFIMKSHRERTFKTILCQITLLRRICQPSICKYYIVAKNQNISDFVTFSGVEATGTYCTLTSTKRTYRFIQDQITSHLKTALKEADCIDLRDGPFYDATLNEISSLTDLSRSLKGSVLG